MRPIGPGSVSCGWAAEGDPRKLLERGGVAVPFSGAGNGGDLAAVTDKDASPILRKPCRLAFRGRRDNHIVRWKARIDLVSAVAKDLIGEMCSIPKLNHIIESAYS
jgi:hypothetical protein